MVKYYKKILVDRPWNRPNLTSNGVLGGGEFACTSLTPLQASTYDIWHLFNGIEGEDLWSSTSGQGAFVFYNPNPLKVESFEVVNYYGPYNYSSCWSKGSVYGSDDNVNWEKLTDFINESHYNSGEHWAIPVNSTGYYKYHKVQILENVPSGGFTMAREMYITATQQVNSWAECTQAEYDQLADDDRKIVADIYSAFARDLLSGIKLYGVLNTIKHQVVKEFNSSQYSSELQAQEGINGVKFSPSNLYGMTNLSSYINIPQNQKVIFELPDNLVRVNYVHHKGYTVGQVMPAANINQVDVSNDGVKWTTVATYTMPTYGIAGDVTNQLDLPKIKYIRLNFWFHGSGSPSYYGSGGVGSVYINYHVKENGKEKEVVKYYLGGR